MQEPKRLLDDVTLAPESRALLESMSPTPPMPPEVRADLAARIDRVAAAPAAGSAPAAGWLILASIAGLGVMLWSAQPAPSPPLAPPIVKTVPGPTHQVRYVEAAPAVRPSPDPAPVDERGGLPEELRLLDGAHERSEQEALARVRAHRRRFPSGQLSDLRDYVEIQVFVRRGDLARARRLADRFFTTHPHSALTEELRRTLSNEADR
jgi:hypothetical protein